MFTEHDQDLLTMHVERAAFEIFCRESINPVLQKMSPPVSTKLEVNNTKKEKIEVILAQSINNNALWEKFYTAEGADLDRGSLDNIEEKATRIAHFLIHTHKQKYQFIKYDKELEWLGIVTGVSALMKSAEWRYQEKRYKDQEACQRLERILVRREENVAFAKGWGHAKKHPEEDAKDELAQVWEEGHRRVNDTFFLPYKTELPILPPGLVNPLAWLTARAGGR